MVGRIAVQIRVVLGSKWFWRITLAFFVFEALWIAFSAAYPLAFDEDFHFGVISIYAERWSPWLGTQPPSADQFGALARDASYLYHYLFSFPLRFLQALTDSQTTQIIVLRLLNIGLFAAGLVLARRLLLRAGTSRAAAHTALALFVLIPTVPLLAAHINYDNLLMLLVPALLLCVLRFRDGLQHGQIDVPALSAVLALCLFGSVVKYAFLPMALAAGTFCAAYLWRAFGRRKKRVKTLGAAFKAGLAKIPRWTLLVLSATVLIGAVLFAERYVVNTVRYGNPVASCEAVLSDQRCLAYSPWARNYYFEHSKPTHSNANPVVYTVEFWFEGMARRLFFMIAGPHVGYDTQKPLPVVYAAGITLASVGTVLTIVYIRRVFKDQPGLVLIVGVAGLYTAALWWNNYTDYVNTGRAVAVNGRYFIPLLLPLSAVMLRAFSIALRRMPTAKPLLASVVIVLFLQGGGVGSFILGSKPNWYWPNPAVREVNQTTQSLLKPLIIEGPRR